MRCSEPGEIVAVAIGISARPILAVAVGREL